MGSDYRVKGSTLNTKFQYLRECFGDRAEQALQARFRARKLFPILDADWYDYDLYVELLEALAELHFGSDVSKLVAVGEYSAKQSLTSVYQAFVRGSDFLEFLGRISALHRLFYSHGRMEVRLWNDRDGCDILHRDKPRYADADLYVALGFYLECGKLHALRDVSGTFSVDEDGAQFSLSWA